MTFTTGGIIFMIVAWGLIISLIAYCMTKVLRNQGPQSPPED